ncbi:MAG: Uma2 family endonuclease [Planctomycetales bacterium]
MSIVEAPEIRETLQSPPPRSKRGEPTWEIAYQFPYQGDWTEEAFLNTHWEFGAELSDGCVEFLPMTSPRHMFPQELLLDRIRQWLRKHQPTWVAFPPKMPIRLFRGTMRDPDIRVLRPEHMPARDKQPTGAELVVEIVSPGDEARERDLVTKRQEYAKAAIPEYWIVDLEQRLIIVLALPAGKKKYKVHGEFGQNDEATSIALPGFKTAAAKVFAAADGESTTGQKN